MAICNCNCHKGLDQPCDHRHCCANIGQQKQQHENVVAPPYADGLLSPERGIKQHYSEGAPPVVDNGWMGASLSACGSLTEND